MLLLISFKISLHPSNKVQPYFKNLATNFSEETSESIVVRKW